jgi:hypothetical protein
VAVSFDTRLQQLRDEEAALHIAIAAKQNEIGGPCIKSATNICGRITTAAPNPWLTAEGNKCAGHDTIEALEGLFCAHWGSPVSSQTSLPLLVPNALFWTVWIKHCTCTHPHVYISTCIASADLFFPPGVCFAEQCGGCRKPGS